MTPTLPTLGPLPDGWPTLAMIAAGNRSCRNDEQCLNHFDHTTCGHCIEETTEDLKAALSAAPAAPWPQAVAEPVATLLDFDTRIQIGTVDLHGNWRDLRVGDKLFATQPPTQQASAPIHELAKSVIKAREVYGWSVEADAAILALERGLWGQQASAQGEQATQAAKDVLLFLLGEAQLNGYGFGEKPEGVGNYWWRKYLRASFENLLRASNQTGEIMSLLTEPEIDEAAKGITFYTHEDRSWYGEDYTVTVDSIPGRREFARAIEAATAAKLNERIAELDELSAERNLYKALHQGAEKHIAELQANLDAAMTDAELVSYILQDDIHNRLTPRVLDIAYTAFMIGRSGKNKDDGGPCDWFNDTKPMVLEQIGKIKKDLSIDSTTRTV